ncbi:unnamed protein product [Blepharisma stoltei]|uniref:Uncharacterized protein n=1 Tax=Blepharisma stoltei TaxID=1481888 RepID=A0AAU9KJP3_9CILI|nr:unnamed protein product [Blepharisma stoltei]
MGLFAYAKHFSRALTKMRAPAPNMQFSNLSYRLQSTVNPSTFLIKSPEFQTMVATLGKLDAISISDDDEEVGKRRVNEIEERIIS